MLKLNFLNQSLGKSVVFLFLGECSQLNYRIQTDGQSKINSQIWNLRKINQRKIIILTFRDPIFGRNNEINEAIEKISRSMFEDNFNEKILKIIDQIAEVNLLKHLVFNFRVSFNSR